MTVYCKHDRNLQQSLNLSKIFFDKALTFQNNYQYDSAIYYYKKEINNKKNDTVY